MTTTGYHQVLNPNRFFRISLEPEALDPKHQTLNPKSKPFFYDEQSFL